MPLFELFRLAKGKLDSAQDKPTPGSDDSCAGPQNGFSELAWENGQVVMQGRCGPWNKKSLSLNTDSLKAHGSKLGSGDNARASKIGNLGFGLSEFPDTVPSPEICLNQEDDMVPWTSYPMSGSLNNDYSSDYLPELPGVAVNVTSLCNNIGSVSKNGQGQLYRDSLFSSLQNGNGLEEGTRVNTSNMQMFSSSLPLESQILSGSFLKLQRADSGPSSNATNPMNFSYLARPTPITKSNNNSSHKMCGFGLSGFGRADNRDMGPAVDTTNNSNSKPVVSSNGLGKGLVPGYQNSVQQQRFDRELLDGKSSKEPVCARKSEAVILEDSMKGKEDKFSNQSWRLSGLTDGEETLNALGGSSSVCSGNSVERASDDPKHGLKRKSQETEESEDRSEDVGDELVSAKKQTTARYTSSRRSRTAEVHNLSERRRRDRINEKMRALQELIPNCSKVDKASMLDEAIEYVKALKLQLQMVTMGAGFYVPPMMLPTGMQHMGHMPFPMGMGYGLEFGMGMPPMNMHGAHFPGPLMPGLHAVPGSNLHMYGLHGQGLIPRTPLVPFPGIPGMKTATGPSNAYGAPGPVENQHHTMVSSGKESAQSINKQSSQNTGSSCLSKQRQSSQSLVVSSGGQASDKKNNARGVSDPANRSEPGPKATGG